VTGHLQNIARPLELRSERKQTVYSEVIPVFETRQRIDKERPR